MTRSFEKILVANRGEIAVRVIRACRELGIASAAVYSDADRTALHARMADEALPIGPAPAAESYLRADRIVEAALRCGARAVHPGYGFLSERAHFARACADAGLAFIGPPPEAIAVMGDKVAAKRLAERAGVPTLPGYMGEDQSPERLLAEAERAGFPLLIKASAGGGGRGMRVVRSAAEFGPALEGAVREARAAFGDGSVFLERLVERPRHVEVQVLADARGGCVHLFERECSIQRRHQKVVEESPSVALGPALRAEMGAAAVGLARAAGYVGAGTVEFLLDDAGRFSFLEMNTRLQVEHPVTELVTGLDLVQLQIAIAAGAPLPFAQADLAQRGHAIEVRVCAEDPATYLPAAGRLAAFAPPEGPGVRNDVGVAAGDEVGTHYDPLLAKLIVHAPDRAACVARLRRALGEYVALGVQTNLDLLRAIAAHPAFAAGETQTDFLERHGPLVAGPGEPPAHLVAAAALYGELRAGSAAGGGPWEAGPWRAGGGAQQRLSAGGRQIEARVARRGGRYDVRVGGALALEGAEVLSADERGLTLRAGGEAERCEVMRDGRGLVVVWRGASLAVALGEAPSVDTLGGRRAAGGRASLEAPMPGTVVRALVAEGQEVEAHQPLLVLEAMKMEHIVAAPHAGVVRRVLTPGALVARGDVLAEVEAAGGGAAG